MVEMGAAPLLSVPINLVTRLLPDRRQRDHGKEGHGRIQDASFLREKYV